MAEQQNDSIAVNYTGVDPEKFATFIVNVVGKSDEASYIVQLLNESGKLLQEKNRRAQRSMPFQLRTGRQREVPHHRGHER